jgi:hypothetical protein
MPGLNRQCRKESAWNTIPCKERGGAGPIGSDRGAQVLNKNIPGPILRKLRKSVLLLRFFMMLLIS